MSDLNAQTVLNATLHQLASSPKAWANDLTRIKQVWQPQDLLLLLGEAAQGYQYDQLEQFTNRALLATDAALLGIDITDKLFGGLKIFSSDDWANAVLTYQRCITWR